jgi:hypothetical protein
MLSREDQDRLDESISRIIEIVKARAKESSGNPLQQAASFYAGMHKVIKSLTTMTLEEIGS